MPVNRELRMSSHGLQRRGFDHANIASMVSNALLAKDMAERMPYIRATDWQNPADKKIPAMSVAGIQVSKGESRRGGFGAVVEAYPACRLGVC